MITLDHAPVRLAAAVLAVLAGLVAGWAAAGSFGLLAVFAVLLAAGNGYEKAYSP